MIYWAKLSLKEGIKVSFFDIVASPEDIDMLVALSKADIGSLNQYWLEDVSDEIDNLRVEALQRLQGDAFMIKVCLWRFFSSFDADIMINTVNCVGVMGAGVALAFKKRFPEMFDDYAEKMSFRNCSTRIAFCLDSKRYDFEGS